MLMAFYLANKEKKILATGNAPFYSSCVARKGIRKESLSARVVESVLVQRPLLTSKNLEAIAQTVVLLFPELSLARLFSYSLQGRKGTKITSSRDKAKKNYLQRWSQRDLKTHSWHCPITQRTLCASSGTWSSLDGGNVEIYSTSWRGRFLSTHSSSVHIKHFRAHSDIQGGGGPA